MLGIGLQCDDVNFLSLAEAKVVQYHLACIATRSMSHDARFTGVHSRKIKTPKTPQNTDNVMGNFCITTT